VFEYAKPHLEAVLVGKSISDTQVVAVSKPGVGQKNLSNTSNQVVTPSPAKIEDSSATIIGTSYEQCVIYAEFTTGITKHIGYAGDAQPEGQTPKINSIALERKYGHAMVVVSIQSNGIIVHEANYIKGKIDERFIPYSDVRGYIY
jgi:surface antigen